VSAAVVATMAVVGMLGASSTADAAVRGVINRGPCTGDSHRALLLLNHGDHLGVVFRVREGVVGDRWRVRIAHGDHLLFVDTRITKRPDGSFTIRRPARNFEGRDLIRAHARNLATGEVCSARAVI
jgi:hypothetical protein